MTDFVAQEIDGSYAVLSQISDDVLRRLISMGATTTLPAMVAGVVAWRDQLLEGRLPPVDTWPGSPIDGAVRAALAALDVPRYCRGEPELVERLLVDIVESFRERTRTLDELIAENLRALESLPRVESDAGPEWKRDLALQRQQRQRDDALERAMATFREDSTKPDARFMETWSEQARAWASLYEIFGELGLLVGRGWDMGRGVLRHVGWSEAVRLSQLVERLTELQEIIRTLGRLHESEDERNLTEILFGPMLRTEIESEEVRTPLVPAETRGVQRGGDFSRMLPAEAMLLSHPTMRMLWHARRAERSLMTYRVEGTELLETLVERETEAKLDERGPSRIRGPMIVVVDTSGSMHGVPETVAKALCLETMRVAHSEGRDCLLFAFSGPGDVAEMILDASDAGLGRLLDFLGWSFYGGTDIEGPVERVLERLEEDQWSNADVLLLTDGEWPVGRDMVERIDAQRETGTRFHGVLIGNRHSAGLEAVCEDVHVFSAWEKVLEN